MSKTTRNPITGDFIRSRVNSKSFEDGFDLVFRKPQSKPIEDWDEKRMDIIGSNGNDGLHYEGDKNE